MVTDKVKLRQTLLEMRQSMSQKSWRERSDRVCTSLQASPLFQSAQTILAYFSFRHEPDLSLLFHDTKHLWGFPRCVDKSLLWHSWKPGEPQEKGRYGIFEPVASSPPLQAQDADLILVPAVACDVRGYRLGYGGGYYDRLLSQRELQGKCTIGIVFESAYLPQLPIEPWDIPLHGVCTEAGLKRMR